MNTVFNIFSTSRVKMAYNHLKYNEFAVKVNIHDRELYRRQIMAADLVRSWVTVKETDLLVLADRDIGAIVRNIVITERDRLEHYIAAHPSFRESMTPVKTEYAPPRIVRLMIESSRAAGVGPMAAVAGAVCEMIAAEIGDELHELIIENGGDCLIKSSKLRTVGIFAGDGEDQSPIGVLVRSRGLPIAVCTSSGRIGHSVSFGDSAAATVIAPSCALADAAATAVGNSVRGRDGISAALQTGRSIPGVLGVVVMRDGEMGAWGDVELVRI
jgi:hypothetical protein